MAFTRSIVMGLIVAAAPAVLLADVRIVETTKATLGSRTGETTRTTSIKGDRMRVDVVQTGEDILPTLYDLPAGATITLDAKHRRAEVRDIAARDAKLEKEYPRQRTQVTVTPTGATKTLLDTTCDEHAVTVRVPITKDGGVVLVMSGSAWMARRAPGAADYAAFAAAANQGRLVLGIASDNLILLALTRAQTETYRALATIGGIPYDLDLTIAIEGKGMLASMVRKLLAGHRTNTVTTVTTEALSDSLFAVPAGWSQQRK